MHIWTKLAHVLCQAYQQNIHHQKLSCTSSLHSLSKNNAQCITSVWTFTWDHPFNSVISIQIHMVLGCFLPWPHLLLPTSVWMPDCSWLLLELLEKFLGTNWNNWYLQVYWGSGGGCVGVCGWGCGWEGKVYSMLHVWKQGSSCSNLYFIVPPIYVVIGLWINDNCMDCLICGFLLLQVWQY